VFVRNETWCIERESRTKLVATGTSTTTYSVQAAPTELCAAFPTLPRQVLSVTCTLTLFHSHTGHCKVLVRWGTNVLLANTYSHMITSSILLNPRTTSNSRTSLRDSLQRSSASFLLSFDQCEMSLTLSTSPVGVFKLFLVFGACTIFVPENIADDTGASLAASTAKDGLGSTRWMDLTSSTSGCKTAEETLFRG
jgi:hypothetical protein